MIKPEIKHDLDLYPISDEQIVQCAFNAAGKLNHDWQEFYFRAKYIVVSPKDQCLGGKYEIAFRDCMNDLGILKFESDPNQQCDYDLTYRNNNKLSIELKTCNHATKNRHFTNSTRRNSSNSATKHYDPDGTYYILVKHHSDIDPSGIPHMEILEVYFGKILHSDWKVKSSSSYLVKEIIDSKFKRLYPRDNNDKG